MNKENEIIKKRVVSLQWICSFQASSKVESGMRGLPAWHTNKLPASIVVGNKLNVLTVTLPSGDVFSSTELRICDEKPFLLQGGRLFTGCAINFGNLFFE